MEMEKEKKEKIALILGFFLILIVILITLFRSKLFTSTDNSSPFNLDEQISSELGYNTINAEDLSKKILLAKKDSHITLLDVRPFDSYIKEHLLDAINLTPDDFPLNSKIDPHSQVVVVGADENDENIKVTADELKKEGFQNFLVLIGGMSSWQQIGGVTVTYGDPNLFTDQSKVSYVKPEDLNDALKKKVPMFIIDVGTPEAYAKGHISGAINIPSDDLEKRRSEIIEKRVIVVGPNELQEFQSSVQMYDMLLVSPFVLKGAMPQWIQKGYPVVK
jgi:rhodanese-related sulfurtransferase